ncbi:MAG: hypothetical protein ACH34U_14060 [Cyanobium sp.]
MSIDNHCRHRGSDERDAQLLLKVEGVSGEGDVVIGGEERDQAEGKAANGFRQPQPVETQWAKTQRAKN